MRANKKKQSITKVTATEQLEHTTQRPEDYHCTCEYCTGNFIGDIKDGDLFYHAKAKETYFPKPNPEDKHLDAGHFQGYRWAIHNFTEPGDWVLDPTVGTGTAVIEAINNGRNGIGIELEYPHIGQSNIDAQEPHSTGKYLFRQGDAKNIDQYLDEWDIKENSIQLILNGTPYPTLSGKSSDSPERKSWKAEDVGEDGSVKIGKRYYRDESFDYNHSDNIGKKKGDEYWDLVNTMYTKSIKYLKPGGYFITIIKDMTRNKEPYLLHKMVTDEVIKNNPEMEYYGAYTHKHWPPTLHMSTYPKKFPGVQVPTYQTAIVLRKR
jgi:hypothetical protein